MADSPLILQLVEALSCLPGVGPKSARRMSYHLLERDREGGRRLAGILLQAMEHIGHCRQCRVLSEDELCPICIDERRDQSLLCIVETPSDVYAMEQTTTFRGRYFVLMGHLSPLDGIGPGELGLDHLVARFATGQVNEVILATNPTVEGEATAHYIAEIARHHGIHASRIACGVPFGGELEYLDASTLSHAMQGRKAL